MKPLLNLSNNWTFFEPSSKRWLDAQVPGCIHTDLLRHKLIPDPFWGSNEHDLQWIGEREWKYRCEFKVDAGLLNQTHIELVAEGLDTVATLRLNGRRIGTSGNMFVGYRFDVQQGLRQGDNVLEILFDNQMDYLRARQQPDDLPEWNDPVGGVQHIRKMQCQFGWDWGPRLVTCGIYKAIRLEAWISNRIVSVHVSQLHTKGAVELTVKPELISKSLGTIRGTVSLGGKVVAEVKNHRCTIADPQLWWPNCLGAQPLYELRIELVEDGSVVDFHSQRIGLRTIVLDRHADEFGETFQFAVNGRTIFAKGANWIPAHSFVTEADRAFYDNILSSAAAANMNMLRVWGGGIYESDDFYDLCDEKGLLVWQDFMFACSLYPGTPEFLGLVREEAEYQVKRLANRACLALWCGNNEIEQMPQEIIKTRKRKKAYDEVFYKILPNAVQRFDGNTPYWPSSPHNPEGYEKGHNNERAGDCHFWDVWHARKPVKTYEQKNFRFCSEFGMQSYCSPEVAATFCKPEEFNVFSPAMENHQKNGAGNQIILDYISRLYRFPKDYAALSYLSQLNQAWCMKVGIEHFRRSMPRTMGALYWQINDCWPVASWSSLEFGGRWKALQYAARRFFAPALVSAHVPGEETVGIGNSTWSTIHEVNLFTIYDGIDACGGDLRWTLYHLDGRILTKGLKKQLQLIPGESVRQAGLDFAKDMAKHGAANLFLRVWLEIDGALASENTVLFTAPRFIALPRGKPKASITKIGAEQFEIEFCADTLVYQLAFDFPQTNYRADDNYFDLFPGVTHRVKITSPSSITELRKKLTIASLVDSY